MILFINFDYSMNFISFTLKGFKMLIVEMGYIVDNLKHIFVDFKQIFEKLDFTI